MVCRAPGQGPTEREDVECAIYMERCPFDVEIIGKMREEAAVFKEQAA